MVSIVVPVRNEAGNITPLIAEIVAALGATFSFEVIYVNDGSTDKTESELTLLMASRPWLRHIIHRSSCGQSAALRTGVMHARAQVVVTLDGDGQNDPAFIPALLSALAAGMPRVGLIAGQRVGRKASRLQADCSRASPMACAARSCATARATPAAASRRSAATCSWRCRISTGCTGSCRRWSGARATRSAISTWSTGRAVTARRTTALWDRLWVGILDLFGVWWLIRRRRQVPDVLEVKRHAD